MVILLVSIFQTSKNISLKDILDPLLFLLFVNTDQSSLQVGALVLVSDCISLLMC